MSKVLTRIVTEVNRLTGKHIAYHRINIDKFQAATSFNAFFNSSKQRNMSDGRVFIANTPEDHDAFVQHMVLVGMEIPPIEDVGSIWNFYNKIGYDYKRKRFDDTD